MGICTSFSASKTTRDRSGSDEVDQDDAGEQSNNNNDQASTAQRIPVAAQAVLDKVTWQEVQDMDSRYQNVAFLSAPAMGPGWTRAELRLCGNYLFACGLPSSSETSQASAQGRLLGVLFVDEAAQMGRTYDVDGPDSMKDSSGASVPLENIRMSVAVEVADRHHQVWSIGVADAKEATALAAALQETVDDSKLLTDMPELCKRMQQGAFFEKRNYQRLGALSRKDRERFVKVCDEKQFVQWGKADATTYDQVAVVDIARVIAGAETDAFKRGNRGGLDPALCFSIVTAKRTLDLIAPSRRDRDAWVRGLRGLVKFRNGHGGLEATYAALMERQAALQRLHDKSAALRDEAEGYSKRSAEAKLASARAT